eukprot:RCo018100
MIPVTVDKRKKPAEKLSAQRFDRHKLSSPFSQGAKHKTAFAEAYARGDIPCHLEHHTARVSLIWTVPLEQIDVAALLPLCCDGLRETQHPYTQISRQAIRDLLLIEDVRPKVSAALEQIIPALRLAIIEKESDIFDAVCVVLGMLSDIVKEEFNPHVHHFLSALNKRYFDRKQREPVERLLNTFEQNGGSEISKLIKAKIPTYTPLYR